jgi:serine/threonine protein kinase/tetratricopeptide (TPR) repeat protein
MLDELVEQFEESWTGESRHEIPELLREHGLGEDGSAATELIRVDICRRYSKSQAVDLRLYFQLCPWLSHDARWAPQIAFEDYRSRRRLNLPLWPKRWADLPGIAEQAWYCQILALGSSSPAAQSHAQPSSFLLAASAGGASHVAADPNGAEFEKSLRQAGFSLVRRIREGAFSTVYLAIQHELCERYVVLKVVDRPWQEPQQLARLQHTNIVPIYSFHQIGSRFAICMPYAGVVTLADYLGVESLASSRCGHHLVTTVRQRVHETISTVLPLRSPTPQDGTGSEDGAAADDQSAMQPLDRLQSLQHHELALWMFSRLAAALAHSHARGVLHCDLKPANILIRNDGEPALLDFNLSQRLHHPDHGRAGGTLAYMPPEFLRAMMGQSVPRSVTADVYSLGVILYEFVTGRLPFPLPRSLAPLDLEAAVETRRPQLRWQRDEQVPGGLRVIIGRCLQFDPASRYASAEQLQRDLECELHHQPLQHTPEPSLASRLRKWTRRHPRCSSAGVLGLAAVALVLALSGVAWRLRESNRDLASQTMRDAFRARSAVALANLMAVDESDRSRQLRAADECLQMYGVLSDPHWQQSIGFRYLDATSQRLVLNRLTDLLLRTASAELSDKTELPSGKPRASSSMQRLGLLAQAPFAQVAPVAIARLKRQSGLPPAKETDPLPALDHQLPLDVFAEALYRLNRDRGEEAMQLLDPALLGVIDPFSYWIAVGRAQLDSHQLPAAEISFSMAIELLQQSPIGYYFRGLCRMQMRQRDKIVMAEADFDGAIERTSTFRSARIARALAREVAGDLPGAVSDMDSVLQADENNNRGLIIRSRLHRKLGNHRLSQLDLEAALVRPPASLEDWVARALARLPSDRHAALDDLNLAQRIDPTSVLVLQNRAHLLSEHFGDVQQAIECLDQLLLFHPTSEAALLGRAVLQARQGDRVAALHDLETAADRVPQWSPASLYQAGCTHSLLAAATATEPDAAAASRRQALQYLSQAIQRGYGGELLETDPDLESLRSDPMFNHLLQTTRIGLAR